MTKTNYKIIKEGTFIVLKNDKRVMYGFQSEEMALHAIWAEEGHDVSKYFECIDGSIFVKDVEVEKDA